ncbi:MAG: beta-galactosidase [Planctomycetota bacterium]|jgi:hypothetical protein
MAEVTMDNKSFLIDGERIWLHSGAIHYFRHPHEDWEKVLLRAKRGGLNCIETYTAWNMHERSPGSYNFEGRCDLGRYLDLIHDLGMYAFVRPGPYICSEWDGGALPGWLYAFNQLIPIIAERQVTKGGPVLLVQNENEYRAVWNDSTRDYILGVKKMLTDHGITVPITGCNAHPRSSTEVHINYTTNTDHQLVWPDLLITLNCSGDNVEVVRDLRKKQPQVPVLSTELWNGPIITWDKPDQEDYPGVANQARYIYEFASLQAQSNAYMYDGGTNFGWWGAANLATSYDAAYCVREGGILHEKYYRCRPGNLFCTHFGADLAESDEVAEPTCTAPASVRFVQRRSSRGDLLFLSSPVDTAAFTVSGEALPELEVCLTETTHAAVLPLNFSVAAGITLDYANLSLLAEDRERKQLFLYGMAGATARISINGREESLVVPSCRVAVLNLDGATLLIMDEVLATRTWFAEGRVVIGPDFVGAATAAGLDARFSSTTPTSVIVEADATLTPISPPGLGPLPELPALSTWKRTALAETTGQGEGWLDVDSPRPHEMIDGALYGYVWYRAEFSSEREGTEQLLFTKTDNPVLVFADGVYCGKYAAERRNHCRWDYHHPADFLTEPVHVPVKKGRNQFIFLSENQGRDCGGGFDVQGIEGPVFVGARRYIPREITNLEPAPVPTSVARDMHAIDYQGEEPLRSIEFDLLLAEGEIACFQFSQHHCGYAENGVVMDGEHVRKMPLPLYPFNTVMLPEGRGGNTHRIRIFYRLYDDHSRLMQGMQIFIVPGAGRLNHWAVQPMADPIEPVADSAAGGVAASARDKGPELLQPTITNPELGICSREPTVFSTIFARPVGDEPVLLELGGLHKGQAYLNGRNLGRFWTTHGVQKRMYLPRAWMEEENTLVIFEELGVNPGGVQLSWARNHPVAMGTV